MPTLVDFRRRIRSVQNTQKITRAMKLVSAAKLRRAQENVFNARPYAGQMQAVLKSLARRMEGPTHPLLEKREEKRILVLILSGDKGLCGPFNTNILRLADSFMARNTNGTAPGLITIGRRSTDYYRRRKKEIIAEHVDLFMRGVTHEDARVISEKVNELYTAKEVDAVYVIYNEFKSILTQRLITEKLLPIEGVLPTRQEGPMTVMGQEYEGKPKTGETEPPTEIDYLYEQRPAELLKTLLPRHVEVQIFRTLLESNASEHAARMTAMDAATNNAGEMIDKLTLFMNKARQAQITRELIEIVSGAAAL
jgi:F-type H+-transporting ATPase subunit gamma